ncbi:hypothetical protein LV89_03821 [Arcicella aurantiaca]|uniref:Uncharacterized protein n=1 Tax=Arcicella aurantiaca TaxID=591202 RepID=A0A316DSW5_9BACT|nr:hypothetical protein LV89_03821 [Arcicella aurantiaca]
MNALKIFGLIFLFIALCFDVVAMAIETILFIISPESSFYIVLAFAFSLGVFIFLFDRIYKSI